MRRCPALTCGALLFTTSALIGGCSSDGSANDGPPVPALLQGLPTLTNVVQIATPSTVVVTFDPIDGAQDYRIYPLPADSDLSVDPAGVLMVHNGTYRCGGDRQTDNAIPAAAAEPQNGPPKTLFNPDPSQNILGYVYQTPGDGRVPVYAVAGLASAEDGWREARPKYYLTDTTNRDRLLAQTPATGVQPLNTLNAPDWGAWRDEGTVFYIPASSGANTAPIYHSEACNIVAGQGWTKCQLSYFGAGELAMHQGDKAHAPAVVWNVLSGPVAGAVPLYRVHYQNGYSGPLHEHDELVPGLARFQRAANQGNSPLWALHWSGLAGPTTLVVEALDSGCPYQGFLAPSHLDASYNTDGTLNHQPLLTLDELRAASPTGEVFINGQHQANNRPRAVARSFVQFQPPAPLPLDWRADFSQPLAPFAPAAFPNGTLNDGFGCERFKSTDYDLTFNAFDFGVSQDGKKNWPTATYGALLGEFWVAYDDTGHDVTGSMRLTPSTKATMSQDSTQYLHATMSVDIVTTDRRYPQLIVSDLDAPVQDGFASGKGTSVILQPFLGPSNRIEVQAFTGLINGKGWAVNNQAPRYILADDTNINAAADSPFEHAGMDRTAQFDLYLSSKRAYVFVDGAPSGCADLSMAATPKGPVTVTFGDVIYHEGAADELVCSTPLPYGFLHTHQCVETKRHYHDLGFKSGVPAPNWDEGRIPCTAKVQ